MPCAFEKRHAGSFAALYEPPTLKATSTKVHNLREGKHQNSLPLLK
jgi:hypothetical protein